MAIGAPQQHAGRVMSYSRQARREFHAGANLYVPQHSRPTRYAVGNCPTPPICPPGDEICRPDQKRLFLGFLFAAVGAGATQTVTALPQTLFRPDQFFIPSFFADSFVIEDVIIGNRSQLSSIGTGIPGAVFSEVSVNSQVIWDTCQPGVQVIIRVTNISGDPADFRAAMAGYAVQSL